MKSIKHIITLCLSLVMIFSLVITSGVMTASAVAGAGIQQTSFRSYGIDVSYWNVAVGSSLDFSRVDFAKLKADGCQFAILRIGYEASASRQDTMDTSFLEFYKRARAAGMPLGVYFYGLSTTKAGAVADAKWVIDVIEKNNMYFEYPIYYDIEDSAQVALGSSAMEALCLGWCETLEAAGYFPGIYGGGSQVIDKLSSSFKSKYDLWYPRYKSNYEGNQHAANAYDFSDYCGMWQHAIFGYYNGLASSSVDMNVCYKDYPAIMKQYGYNNCVPDKPDFEGENIALNKTYEATTYGSYTANLTDGKAARNLSYDANWFTFYNNASASVTNAPNKVGSVVINLNGKFDINGIRINAVQNETSGVGIPTAVRAYLSRDGKNWGTATSLTIPTNTTTDIAYIIKGAVDGVTSYVKLEFTLGAKPFFFLNEIEVYGTATTADYSPDLPNVEPSTDKNLSLNKDYTTTSPNRNDAFDDDGVRLTDGTKSQINVNLLGPNGKPYYSGWNSENLSEGFSIDVTVDLESSQESDKYVAYMAGGNWGIELPKDVISMKVYASNDANSGFELVASANLGSAKLLQGAGTNNNSWSLYAVTASTTQKINARYIKFVLTHKPLNSDDGKLFIWLDEVEVLSTLNGGSSGTETPEPEVPNGNNVAFGKDYEGGRVSSAGSYSANLTDGKANTVGAFDSSWYALYYNKDADSNKITAPDGIGTIIIDLEEVFDGITDVRVHVWNSNANGILPAKSIKAFISEDGIDYTEVGNLAIPASDSPAWATLSTDNVSARYVKLVIETQAVWTFLNEIEVIADPDYVPEGDVSDPDVSDPEVSDPEIEGTLGDVDEDGDVDAADYVLVKRAVLNTYELSEQQKLVADIDADGDVDAADYVLVKRIVLGTYTVQ